MKVITTIGITFSIRVEMEYDREQYQRLIKRARDGQTGIREKVGTDVRAILNRLPVHRTAEATLVGIIADGDGTGFSPKSLREIREGI